MTKEELEKEAEGYREKGKREGYYLVSQEMEQEELDYIIDETFKDGAEFGYNKAKVEVEESYRESLCNSELNLASVTEQLEELEKANEWHYVKDGKYPKEKQLVMVYRINPLGANIAITNWYDSYKDTKVIAWKEIVLPELKESE